MQIRNNDVIGSFEELIDSFILNRRCIFCDVTFFFICRLAIDIRMRFCCPLSKFMLVAGSVCLRLSVFNRFQQNVYFDTLLLLKLGEMEKETIESITNPKYDEGITLLHETTAADADIISLISVDAENLSEPTENENKVEICEEENISNDRYFTADSLDSIKTGESVFKVKK